MNNIASMKARNEEKATGIFGDHNHQALKQIELINRHHSPIKDAIGTSSYVKPKLPASDGNVNLIFREIMNHQYFPPDTSPRRRFHWRST